MITLVPKDAAASMQVALFAVDLWEPVEVCVVRHCLERGRTGCVKSWLVQASGMSVTPIPNPLEVLSVGEAIWLNDDIRNALDNIDVEVATPLFVTSDEYEALKSIISERNIQ